MTVKRSFLALCTGLMTLSANAYADGPAQKPDPLMALAHEAAAYAGAARYCNADEDLVDEYIAKTEAKIRVLAKDEYERVLAQVEFKNFLTVASAKEPVGGCDAFLPMFEEAVKKTR